MSHLLREGLYNGDKGESRWMRLVVKPWCCRAHCVGEVKKIRVIVTSDERSKALKLNEDKIIGMVEEI